MKKVLVVYSKSFKLKKILPNIFTNINILKNINTLMFN